MFEDEIDIPISVLIEGSDMNNVWAKEVQTLTKQPFILAGEDYKGNAVKCRDMNVLCVLDEAAVEKIVNGEIHPMFESRKQAFKAYDREFTYDFVYTQWKCAHTDVMKVFDYNYMDRFINMPMPHPDFKYQGHVIPTHHFDPKYINQETHGFDQIMRLHDMIREDGISRRHQIGTWIAPIDDFAQSPPCLQRIWVRVLVPKSEWHKYPGCIPVEVHILYRSWDIGRAQLSNLYGLLRMLYRYVFGNLTAENEYVRGADGKFLVDENDIPSTLNDAENKIEFKVASLKLYGDAGHYYADFEETAKKVKPVARA